jgi:hypothetical protein
MPEDTVITFTVVDVKADILAELPDAGSGLNDGILIAARKLKEWLFLDWHEVFEALLPVVSQKRGKDCTREVTRQVDTVFGTEVTSRVARATQATYEPNLWKRVGIQEATVYDLWEASPVKWNDGRPHTEEVISHLFPGDPWLCVGRSVREFETRRRSEWTARELSRLSFIVPSPAISKSGMTQEGYESQHALTMFPTRKYLVFESDKCGKDEAASVILWLATKWHLILVVDSGGKSLHAWFDAEGTHEDDLQKYFNDLIRLGADEAVKRPSQFVRLPDGLRDNGNRQSIIYYNPWN